MMTRRTNLTAKTPDAKTEPVRQPFLAHVRELQWRLSVVVVIVVLASGAAYWWFDQLVALILHPLGTQQQLVYLTPGGAFGFMLQTCLYVGVVAAVPVLLYQIYRFMAPQPSANRSLRLLGYALLSTILAAIGVVFAYMILLPAALQFLVGFQLQQITPMLTIDAYMAFVMAYIIAGALLFQVPLIVLAIDRITPLPPAKLMRAQSSVIIGSVVMAAVLSPTPDAVNQLFLAVPIIVMYQCAVAVVWLRHRRRLRASPTVASTGPSSGPIASPPLKGTPPFPTEAAYVSPRQPASYAPRPAPPPRPRSVDGIVLPRRSGSCTEARPSVR